MYMYTYELMNERCQACACLMSVFTPCIRIYVFQYIYIHPYIYMYANTYTYTRMSL